MPNAGVVLESRVQRLFLAQGIFAERSLLPSADANHKLLATDIDVLVSEYSSGFHLTRRHAECKSGRRVRILDRVLWLNGVRAMLGADASYFVVRAFDENATDFARSLNIDVMTIRQLQTWENALSIPSSRWPNRSNFKEFDSVRKKINGLGKQEDSPEIDRFARQAIRFVEIDSWRVFGYGRLNRLLRILKDLSNAPDGSATEARSINARYSASALLVRLSQYLLAVCYDVSRVPVSDLHSYLQNRLLFGDQDPRRAHGLVQNTVSWMSRALKDRGMSIPPEIDSSRLFTPPEFSQALVSLTEKLLIAPNEARYLPIAMETEQFGCEKDINLFPRLRSAWHTGRDLVALVKAFAIASLGVDASLLTPLGTNSVVRQTCGQVKKGDDKSVSSRQTELNIENS